MFSSADDFLPVCLHLLSCDNLKSAWKLRVIVVEPRSSLAFFSVRSVVRLRFESPSSPDFNLINSSPPAA